MDATAFCPVCLDEVIFETRKCVETIDVDSETCSFESSLAICPHCGEELDFPLYQQETGRAYSEAVRSAKGLVSLETVCDLPRKYHIGKRPLSKLLGWGEITYTRFMDGHVPSKAYSDRIQELYDHPASYRRVLIEGKERIADSAFKNSLAAVDRILKDDYPDVVRLLEVGEFSVNAPKEISHRIRSRSWRIWLRASAWYCSMNPSSPGSERLGGGSGLRSALARLQIVRHARRVWRRGGGAKRVRLHSGSGGSNARGVSLVRGIRRKHAFGYHPFRRPLARCSHEGGNGSR